MCMFVFTGYSEGKMTILSGCNDKLFEPDALSRINLSNKE